MAACASFDVMGKQDGRGAGICYDANYLPSITPPKGVVSSTRQDDDNFSK